jgi:hypothetical protein
MYLFSKTEIQEFFLNILIIGFYMVENKVYLDLIITKAANTILNFILFFIIDLKAG